MKRHDLNLTKYNISKKRYRELYYFCLQYDDRVVEINALRYPSPPAGDGQPKGSGLSDPTADNATLAAKKVWENEIMEQSALEAAGGVLYPYILDMAKYDLKYYYFQGQNIPCGKNEFDRLRHKFFYLLNCKK
ncbi:MAG: hypothetical protein RSH79_04830 [Clostridiales bacterium]